MTIALVPGKGTKHPAKTAFSNAELVDALEGTGFPFELQLFRRFHEAGLDPAISQRLRNRRAADEADARGTTSEVDLTARLYARADSADGFGQARMTLLVEAKNPSPPTCFVGVLGPQAARHERRMLRASFYGCPTHGSGYYDRNARDLLGPHGIAASLDPLCSAPHCVHWTLVERGKDGQQGWVPKVNRLPNWQEALAGLVRTAAFLEGEGSRFQRELPADVEPLPALGVFLPVLALNTPLLYVYDPWKRKVRKTQSLTLESAYELPSGAVQRRSVDVVGSTGLARYIGKLKRARDSVQRFLDANVNELRGIALGIRMTNAKQRERERATAMQASAVERVNRARQMFTP